MDLDPIKIQKNWSAFRNGNCCVQFLNIYEEYLIYDAVTFISVIGGCLGLCIGISFYNMTGIFLGCLELGLKWSGGGLQKSKAAISHLEATRSSLPNEASWA